MHCVSVREREAEILSGGEDGAVRIWGECPPPRRVAQTGSESERFLTAVVSLRQPHGPVGPLHRGLQVRGEELSQAPPLPRRPSHFPAPPLPPSPRPSPRRCPLLGHGSTHGLVSFQSCARPQYGKWISCLATDSDWMVEPCRVGPTRVLTVANLCCGCSCAAAARPCLCGTSAPCRPPPSSL